MAVYIKNIFSEMRKFGIFLYRAVVLYVVLGFWCRFS
jgi:hypothetical protein